MEFDAWAMKASWDKDVHPYSVERTRRQCIAQFEKFTGNKWRKLKRNGWQCIKIKLVPVEAASAAKAE